MDIIRFFICLVTSYYLARATTLARGKDFPLCMTLCQQKPKIISISMRYIQISCSVCGGKRLAFCEASLPNIVVEYPVDTPNEPFVPKVLEE